MDSPTPADERGAAPRPLEPPPALLAARAQSGRLSCEPGQLRRLTIASVVFALSVGAIVWLVTAFVIRDLSESFISSVITQAKGEAEAVANLAADQSALGEGDTVETTKAAPDAAIDADALLAPFLPQLYDEKGQPLPPALGAPIGTPPEGTPITKGPPQVRRVAAQLQRTGQEDQLIVNGELLARSAFHYIEIRYPGGRSILKFRNVDVKDYDPAVLDPRKNDVRVARKAYPPSSQRVTISWDATVAGQPAKLSAGIDAGVIDEGVRELRRRTIPKVLLGGAVFVVLLVAAYAFVFRLLRESRRLEAEANQRALLAQVGMMAAGLAHEIRNPLSAVQMNLQLIEEDLSERVDHHAAAVRSARSLAAGGGLALAAVGGPTIPVEAGDTDCAEHLTILRSTHKEIRRLGSLVTDFLTYARPSEPRRTPHSFDAVVRDGVQIFEAAARSSGVHLVLDLRACDAPVLIDEAMLKQALMNVVLNAIDAVPHPGGRVLVSTRRAGAGLVLTVLDDGPGLPADPESVFAVFHSTKKGGTGLGLAIARALVERQGGALVGRTATPADASAWASVSTPAANAAGPGAAFVVILPAVAA